MTEEQQPTAPGESVPAPQPPMPGSSGTASIPPPAAHPSPVFCPRCERPVPADARFCNYCGAAMTIACRSCRSANAFGSRYCSVCGLPLDGTARTEAQAATGSARPTSTAVIQAQPVSQVPPPPGDRPSPQSGPQPVSSSADATAPPAAGAPPYETAVPDAVRCPRCTKVNDPGARFCFSCGLPFDEARRTEEAAETGIPSATGFATPAGFGVRSVARVFDQIILIFILLGIYMLWGVLDPEFFANEGPLYLVSIAVEAAYYILAVGLWGTTIGKRAFGLKVVNPQGVRPSMGQAAGRYFASYISAFILAIGYLMVAFRADKRALHDLIAGTWVVHR